MEVHSSTNIVKTPPKVLLRIPSAWIIRKHSFYDLSPDAEPKFKSLPHDDGWLLFENELLIADFRFIENITLDMGWFPNMSADGMFYLRLIKDSDWENRKILCETRSLQEITDVINDAMLSISIENGEYPNGLDGLQLQELRSGDYCHYKKNVFWDIEPSENLTSEQWQLFGESLLSIEKSYHPNVFKLEMGWFPAYDPNGSYQVKLINEKLENPLLEEFATRSKAEVVEYLDGAMGEKMYKLSRKREESERERRRQARLRQQRNLKA
jgi:hypothetical protein